jgi:hypothetical protein
MRLFAVDEAAAVDKTAIYEDKSRLFNVSLIFQWGKTLCNGNSHPHNSEVLDLCTSGRSHTTAP